MAARSIHGAGKGFKERLNDVVRLVAVEEFEVKITAGFVGEALKKFPRQAEAKGAGGILLFLRIRNFFEAKLI